MSSWLQHLRLVSLETNSQRESCLQWVSWDALSENICNAGLSRGRGWPAVKLHLGSHLILWGVLGLRWLSFEVSQILAKGQALLSSLYEQVVYFAPTLPLTPHLPGGCTISEKDTCDRGQCPGETQLRPFSSMYSQHLGVGEHHSIYYSHRLSYSSGNMQCLK